MDQCLRLAPPSPCQGEDCLAVYRHRGARNHEGASIQPRPNRALESRERLSADAAVVTSS